MLYDYPHSTAAVNTVSVSLFGFHPALLPLPFPPTDEEEEEEEEDERAKIHPLSF